jgi:hypothetical protein
MLRTWEVKVIRIQEYKFEMLDGNGKSMIESIMPFKYKITTTMTSQQGTSVYTEYYSTWLIKLKVPFTK